MANAGYEDGQGTPAERQGDGLRLAAQGDGDPVTDRRTDKHEPVGPRAVLQEHRCGRNDDTGHVTSDRERWQRQRAVRGECVV